jgi:hypothetical protein
MEDLRHLMLTQKKEQMNGVKTLVIHQTLIMDIKYRAVNSF